MKMRTLTVAALAAALTAGFGVASASATVSIADDDNPVVIDGITVEVDTEVTDRAELDAFLLSPTPATVVIEPETGELVSVTQDSTPTVTPFIWWTTPGCNTDSLCVRTSVGPPYGFQDKGTKSMTISNAKSYSTGKWSASLVWTYNGKSVTGLRFGPRVSTDFSGALVTVTKLTIY